MTYTGFIIVCNIYAALGIASAIYIIVIGDFPLALAWPIFGAIYILVIVASIIFDLPDFIIGSHKTGMPYGPPEDTPITIQLAFAAVTTPIVCAILIQIDKFLQRLKQRRQDK